MIDFSIIEFLSWVLPSVKRGVAAEHASNLLLVLYVISYIKIKDAAFLVAFLLVEIYGNLYITDYLTDSQYYLGYCLMYCSVYWYVFIKEYSLKILSSYGILVLFELIMCLDALFFPKIETYLYTHYTNIIVFIHLYIITQTISWRKLWARLGASVNALVRMLDLNYNISFIWYTVKNT